MRQLCLLFLPYLVSTIERATEWKPSYAIDEDGLLHQLHATLVQALDASMSKSALTNFQQSPKHSTLIPVLQEGIDAIDEHQRLHALMKGEWGKGLLPQSSIQAHYTVRRIRELAEGTCVKNFGCCMLILQLMLGPSQARIRCFWVSFHLKSGFPRSTYLLYGVPSFLHPGSCILAVGK